MKNWKRFLSAALVCCMTAGMGVADSYAASKKKITSVKLDIEAEIVPDTAFGEERIEISTRGSNYSYDYYEVLNDGFEWEDSMVPEIKVYLTADEDYYFSLTASKIKLDGATYVTAAKQDSSTVLMVTMKLPSLAENLGEVASVTLGDNGTATWQPAEGAGSYEVRMFRSSNGIGNMQTVTGTSQNFGNIMTKEGTYTVKVRPINKVKAEKKGAWTESNTIYVTSEMANQFRSVYGSVTSGLSSPDAGVAAVQQTGAGEWQQDANGWWYQRPDGSYTKQNWEQIGASWYFFDENGYMKTGWVNWQGRDFYCDPSSGAMWVNTSTPDGYTVGADGAKIS